jgi:hypothetical protein
MATKSEVIEFARPEGITYLKALRDFTTILSRSLPQIQSWQL